MGSEGQQTIKKKIIPPPPLGICPQCSGTEFDRDSNRRVNICRKCQSTITDEVFMKPQILYYCPKCGTELTHYSDEAPPDYELTEWLECEKCGHIVSVDEGLTE